MYMYMYMYASTSALIHVRIHVHVHVHVCLMQQSYMYTYVHVHVHLFIMLVAWPCAKYAAQPAELPHAGAHLIEHWTSNPVGVVSRPVWGSSVPFHCLPWTCATLFYY